MSNDMVRELFRGLENTLYERLRIIEDILTKNRVENGNTNMIGVEERLHDMATTVRLVEETTMKEIQSMTRKFDRWMEGMSALQEEVNALRVELRNRKPDDRPVEAVVAELEQAVAESAALDAEVNASEVEVSAKQALKKAVQALPSPNVKQPVIQTVEEEEVEEEEVEEEEEEEEVEEEEVEEEEEEEEALTEFSYKGKTYYHDSEYKVYVPDEDGGVGDPVGIYDPKLNRIRRIT